MNRSKWLVYLGTFLTAASVLELEVALTRIISVMSWPHFTYMIISIALLGFGWAGSYLVLKGGTTEQHGFGDLSRYAFAYSISIVVSLLLVTSVECDVLLITRSIGELLKLLMIESLLAVPFFFAGLTLSHIVAQFQADIHRVYFADLLGASVGCLLSVAAIPSLGATNAVFLAAVLAGVVGLIFQAAESSLKRPKPWALFGFSALTLGLGIWIDPYLVNPAPLKLAFARVSAKAIEDSHWSMLARIDVYKPVIRWIPSCGSEISRRRWDTIWETRFITQDGAAPSWMFRSDGDVKKMEFLDGFMSGAPYVIQKAPRVLVIGVGGGIDVLIGLYNGAKHIVGAEVNSYMVHAIKEKWAKFTGNIFNRPDVEIVVSEGRHFLSKSTDRFDIIQLSGVDTWAATLAGGHVATETYLYTVEGMVAAMQRLTPNGVMAYSRGVLDPPGETLRLAGVMAAGLRRPRRGYAGDSHHDHQRIVLGRDAA